MKDVAIRNGAVVMTPASTAPLSLESYEGSAEGAWGASTSETESGLAADRGSWNR